MKKTIFSGSIILALLFLIVNPATAQTPLDNICLTILNDFKLAASQWEEYVQDRALWVFLTLAVITIAWTGIQLAFKQANLNEFFLEFFKQIMFLGFFFALLNNSRDWMRNIISSFLTMGAAALNEQKIGSVPPASPANIIESCWNVYVGAMQNASFFTSLPLAIASIMLLLIGTYMTAILMVAMIEGYLGVALGQFFLGLGGSFWTKDFATNYVKYIVAVGFKLMVINLGAALAVNMFQGWATIPSGGMGMEEIGALLAGTALLGMVMKMLPEMASNIIAGGQFGTANPGAALTSAAMLGMGMTMGGTKMFKSLGKAGGLAYMAYQAPGNTFANIGSALTQTYMDNVGQSNAMKSTIMGGAFSALKSKVDDGQKPPSAGGGNYNSGPSKNNNL